MTNRNILVTGGAGFIGSAVIRKVIAENRGSVVNVDKLTYAANLQNLTAVAGNPGYHFIEADICDRARLGEIFCQYRPDAVMHLAAESHVDRSIDGPEAFVQTNVVGTFRLLDASLEHFEQLDASAQKQFRFHHVSTDEVFGSLTLDDPPFDADTAYAPRSPYSASKAASDHLVRSWGHTYGLPVVLSNCSNNYGPYQFPEKLIPLIIIRALAGESLPVYGAGENIRDWLHVDDHADALLTILERGSVGQTYLVGGRGERTNIDVVRQICEILDELNGEGPVPCHADLIEFVPDRPGHDLRYAIDGQKVIDDLGWSPSTQFDEGLRRTVEWYLENRDWWGPLLAERYDAGRLGLNRAQEGSK